jgi:hypothetical protein
MKKLFYYLAALLPLSGCVVDGGNDPDSVPVPVDVSTRAAIGDVIEGVELSSVRIIAVDGDGNLVFNEWRTGSIDDLNLDENPAIEPMIGDFHVSLLPDTYDFWVVVNELPAFGLGGMTRIEQLEAIRIPRTALPAEVDMILVGVEREVAISADEGQTVLIPATRVATKLTVMVRKETDDPDDSFTITDAALTNVPGWQYLLPELSNSGAAPADETLFADRTFSFSANSGENDYTAIVEDRILPEYLMAEPEEEALATHLGLEADYYVDGALFPTSWNLPLLGGKDSDGIDLPSLSLKRGTHYTVCVTIRRLAGFDYYITTSVADWEETGGSGVRFEEVITFGRSWLPGTEFEQGSEENTVIVGLNGAARFEFILSNPTAEWTAHLTDNVNFRFDTVEGVTGGFTRPAGPWLIVIRPVGEVTTRTETEFYITVNDGVRTVEVDLNTEADLTGPGERYVIAQTPN